MKRAALLENAAAIAALLFFCWMLYRVAVAAADYNPSAPADWPVGGAR